VNLVYKYGREPLYVSSTTQRITYGNVINLKSKVVFTEGSNPNPKQMSVVAR